MRIYTILDIEAEQYSLPYFAVNDKIAIRMFRETVSKALYVEELELYCLGEFDESTSNLRSTGSILVITGADLVNNKQIEVKNG